MFFYEFGTVRRLEAMSRTQTFQGLVYGKERLREKYGDDEGNTHSKLVLA